MSLKSRGAALVVVIVLAFSGLCSGIFVGHHVHFKKKIDTTQFHGTYIEDPRTINQFSLQGIDGKIFDNQSLQGTWTIVFFGFTNCGSVCPTAMAELAKMYHKLEQEHVKDLPRVIMISLDPERDTHEKLKDYVTSFHPRFYGARGTEEATRLMAREMGVAYEKVLNAQENNGKNYDIQHSGAFMMFNPEGKLNAFFTTPHHADLLAKDYQLLIS